MASWERQEGCELARRGRWETIEVARWKVPGFIQGWETKGDSKISSFYF